MIRARRTHLHFRSLSIGVLIMICCASQFAIGQTENSTIRLTHKRDDDPTIHLQNALLQLDRSNVSFQCANSIQYLQYAMRLKHRWPIRFFDSFGRTGSGQLIGNLFWPGQYRECIEVYAPYVEISKNLSYRTLRGQYCVAWIKYHVSTEEEDDLSIGICAPLRCSPQDLSQLQTDPFVVFRLDCQRSDYRQLNVRRFLCIGLCLLPFLLSIVGSLLDFAQSGRNIRDQYKTLREVDCEQRQMNELPSISSTIPASPDTRSPSTCFDPLSNKSTPSRLLSSDISSDHLPNGPKLTLNLNLSSENSSALQLHLTSATNHDQSSTLQMYLQQALSQSANALTDMPFFQNYFNEPSPDEEIPRPMLGGQMSPDSGIAFSSNERTEKTVTDESRQAGICPAYSCNPVDSICPSTAAPCSSLYGKSNVAIDSNETHNTRTLNDGRRSQEMLDEPTDLQPTPVYTTNEVHLIPRNVTLQRKFRKSTLCLMARVITCFSLRRNIRFLCATHQSRGHPHYAIRCLYPLKFFSLAIVMLGHCYDVFMGVLSNPDELRRDMNNLLFYPLMNGSFAVDTFFTISGVLLSYTFFTRRLSSGPKFWTPANVLRFYLHRYWRLVGVYAFVLAFYTELSPHLGSGPFWQSFYTVGTCPTDWWKNLLFVNNLFGNMYDECMVWTWYVANDMQFFLISPIFLALLAW
jgi:hypothetical protein